MASGEEEADEPLLDWRDELEDEWPPSAAPRSAVICRCHWVEEGELEALIAEGADLEEIARRTGATTACASCRGPIQAMLRARE